MNKEEFASKLRMYLSDPDKKIWNDYEINDLLTEALRQYSIDSGAFTGSFDFYIDANGKYKKPFDFASFMTGWNVKGEEITQTTGRELFARSYRAADRVGDAQYIYDDQSSFDEFKLYPCPPERQGAESVTITPDWGEIEDNDYGVFATSDFGTTLAIDVFDFNGVIYYRKIGSFETVKDYMAVICYALHLAYGVDSEFGNVEMADFWYGMYKKRIAVFGRIDYDNSGIGTTVNFY